MIRSLLLALALGQADCPNGTCPVPVHTASATSKWSKVAVKIEASHPNMTGWGSGVIVASDGRTALVLTNRHVVKGAQTVSVHRLNKIYRANVLRISEDADLASLEISAPYGQHALPIASTQPTSVWSFGFGGSGSLHSHSGQYRLAYTSGDQVYGFAPHDGDSGSAVVNNDGELAGLVWGGDSDVHAAVVSLPKLKAFLVHETCFKWFRRNRVPLPGPGNVSIGGISVQVNDPAVIPAPSPEPVPAPLPVPIPAPVQPPVVITPVPPAPVAVPFDPTTINARLAALESQVTVVAVKNPDGTQSPPKTYSPQVDPRTGQRAVGILLDLNPVAPK